MSQINRPTNRPLPPTEIPDYMYLGFNPTSGQPRIEIYDIIAAKETLGMLVTYGNDTDEWVDFENIIGAGVMRCLFIAGKNLSLNPNTLNVSLEIDGVINEYSVDVPGRGGAADFQGGIALAGSLPAGQQSTRRDTGFTYGMIPFETGLRISAQVDNYTEMPLVMCNNWHRTS